MTIEDTAETTPPTKKNRLSMRVDLDGDIVKPEDLLDIERAARKGALITLEPALIEKIIETCKIEVQAFCEARGAQEHVSLGVLELFLNASAPLADAYSDSEADFLTACEQQKAIDQYRTALLKIYSEQTLLLQTPKPQDIPTLPINELAQSIITKTGGQVEKEIRQEWLLNLEQGEPYLTENLPEGLEL